MKFEQKRMVQWYDARQLASTGIKTVISTIFGNFADKREMQAVLSEEAPFDYSKHDQIWIDYIADLGDGFNSTYTMAHLMAKDHLEFKGGETIKRGDILIMGGDQVYPTPEKQEYENRLQGPYNAAYPWDNNTDLPHLFALPGNHDWYDGLTNFIKLFCQGRALGNWHTQQKRSYFALKLPYRVWIWGIDVQLSSDIDQPQLDYFQTIADSMLPGDRVILCTAEPAWVYRSLTKKDLAYERLEFFKTNYICKHGFALLAMLTGDLHHYSHYKITDGDGHQSHYITAGGGGAFMHPTHFLKDKLEVDGVPIEGVKDSELLATFPSPATSRAMAFWNLLFPLINSRLAFLLGVFFLIMCWFLQSNTKFHGEISFMESIAPCRPGDICQVGDLVRKSLAHNPSVVVLNMILFFGIVGFTDTKLGRGRWNLVAGIAHAATQLVVFYLLVWAFSVINLDRPYLNLDVENGWQVVLFIVEMIFVGGVVSSFVFGVYLLISTLVFKCHPTEAYSSLRWTGYKNFLRIHITKDKITLYPIGVKEVVTNWKKEGPEDKPRFTGGPGACEFIEKPFDI